MFLINSNIFLWGGDRSGHETSHLSSSLGCSNKLSGLPTRHPGPQSTHWIDGVWCSIPPQFTFHMITTVYHLCSSSLALPDYHPPCFNLKQECAYLLQSRSGHHNWNSGSNNCDCTCYIFLLAVTVQHMLFCVLAAFTLKVKFPQGHMPLVLTR